MASAPSVRSPFEAGSPVAPAGSAAIAVPYAPPFLEGATGEAVEAETAAAPRPGAVAVAVAPEFLVTVSWTSAEPAQRVAGFRLELDGSSALGGNTTPRSYRPVTVSVARGPVSTRLFAAMQRNEPVAGVRFDFSAPSRNGGAQIVHTLELGDVHITRFHRVVDADAPRRHEVDEISLSFARIALRDAGGLSTEGVAGPPGTEAELAGELPAAGLEGQLPPAGPQAQPRAVTPENAAALLAELDPVIFSTDGRQIEAIPGPEGDAIRKIFRAVRDRARGRPDPGGRERRRLFDEGVLALRDVLAHASPAQRAKLQTWRASLLFDEAHDRIAHTVLLGGRAIELPRAGDTHREAEVLRAEVLPRLITILATAGEQLHRLAEGDHAHFELAIHALEQSPHARALEQLIHDTERAGEPGERWVARIGALQALLETIDGWLTLTDPELQKRLGPGGDVHGLLPTVTSLTELVKAVLEIGIGSVSLTAALGAGIARAAGDEALAADALAVAGRAGAVLGDVIAGVEIVHGIFVLLDSHASRAEKQDAVVGVLSGSAWFVGARIGGAAVGAAASLAVGAGYLLAQAAAWMYSASAIGLTTGLLSQAFDVLRDAGGSLGSLVDRIAKARQLLAAETEPALAGALDDVLHGMERALATGVDEILANTSAKGEGRAWGGTNVGMPGNVTMLAEAFAPLQHHRGVTPGPALAEAAAAVNARIAWCLIHAQDIVVQSTHHKDLVDVVEGPTNVKRGPSAARDQVLRAIGPVGLLRIEIEAAGYDPADVKVSEAVVAGLDPLWYLTGTNETLTLGDLTAAELSVQGTALTRPVRFTRSRSGQLSYPEIPSDTEQYLRGVARQLGISEKTMAQESFDGLVRVYGALMAMKLDAVNLRP